MTVRVPETSYITMSGSTDSQPVPSNWVQMGLTEITSPLTRQIVRDAAKLSHWVSRWHDAGFIVSEAGSTFSCAEVGIVTVPVRRVVVARPGEEFIPRRRREVDVQEFLGERQCVRRGR